MKIIKYNNSSDIIVEFQDKYKQQVHTQYNNFKNGSVKNSFSKSIYGVGIRGNKYPTRINGIKEKEYDAWCKILARCFVKDDIKRPTYVDTSCCDDWLYYPNFYEWLHSQDNFDKWYNGHRWCVDKDILIKGNKIYSPNTCCLVPDNVNVLFIKSDALRGELPIGVSIHPQHIGKYYVQMSITKNNKRKNKYIGLYNNVEDAFIAYKKEKEKYIKKIADEEYKLGNITKQCRDAMYSYVVEITD